MAVYCSSQRTVSDLGQTCMIKAHVYPALCLKAWHDAWIIDNLMQLAKMSLNLHSASQAGAQLAAA